MVTSRFFPCLTLLAVVLFIRAGGSIIFITYIVGIEKLLLIGIDSLSPWSINFKSIVVDFSGVHFVVW